MYNEQENSANNSFTTVSLKVTENVNDRILDYANDKGLAFKDAITELINTALHAGDMNNGKVNDFTPAAKSQLRAIVSSELDNYHNKIVEAHKNTVVQETIEPTIEENQIVFNTSDDVKIIISKINETRANKGLAPLESSLAEILLHWASNLSEYRAFQPTTGIDFQAFEARIIELANSERTINNAQSNLVEPERSFLSTTFKIVETNPAA